MSDSLYIVSILEISKEKKATMSQFWRILGITNGGTHNYFAFYMYLKWSIDPGHIIY